MSQDGGNGDKSAVEIKKEQIDGAAAAAATTPKPAAAASAAAPAARRFMPNVAVERKAREVQNDPDLVDKAAKPARRPAQPNLGAARGGGRGGRQQANLIQSHSVFEAGPAESTRRFESRNAADNSISRVLGSASSGTGRGGKNEPISMTDPKLEECLVIDDCVEDDNPVYIKFNYDNKENEFITTKIKKEKDGAQGTTKKPERTDKISEKEISVLNDLFNSEETPETAASAADDESLLLFQISEALQLHDIPQSGHVGKLRVHKSGRIDLCINDSIIFDVALSASGPFYQEAFLYQPGAEDPSTEAKLHNLGEIKNKLVCLPQI